MEQLDLPKQRRALNETINGFLTKDLSALDEEQAGQKVHSVRQPFRREPDFGVTSQNDAFAYLLARAETPR